MTPLAYLRTCGARRKQDETGRVDGDGDIGITIGHNIDSKSVKQLVPWVYQYACLMYFASTSTCYFTRRVRSATLCNRQGLCNIMGTSMENEVLKTN